MKLTARPAHTYRAARRNAARAAKLIWRTLPRKVINGSVWVIVPMKDASL